MGRALGAYRKKLWELWHENGSKKAPETSGIFQTSEVDSEIEDEKEGV
ncbi:MAG: hypothetical protein AMXMBFR16_09480 [Candidatus Uhrbacteria bacterium]|jgi:hypothetical protein